MIDESLHNKLRSEYNPDGSILRTVQLNLLDILIEFDRICRKHHIDYWLEYGTLLGAERHGGFIPWDDDLDVSILKKDKKRLERAIKGIQKQGSEHCNLRQPTHSYRFPCHAESRKDHP